MSIEHEAAKAIYEEKQAESIGIEEFEEMESVNPKMQFDFSFLLAKTGEGSVDGYVDHPLNFSRSKGLAQILRGVTGLVGELDLAVVDIGIGTFNMMKEGKSSVADHAGQ